MMSNYIGGPDMTAFKSKAGAMSFAILMNTTLGDDGRRVIDYDEVQKLYDFICERVNLPEVEHDAMSDIVDVLKEVNKDKATA